MCKVSVAHLKPVERKSPGRADEERLAHAHKGAPAPAWSFDAAGTDKSSSDEDTHDNDDAADALPALLGLRKPGSKVTDDVFAKTWRHLNKDVFLQMAFLTGIDPGDYPEIFKVEVPPNLLADILTTICTCFRAEANARDDPERQRLLRAACTRDVDEEWTVRMLEAMAACGRFSLAFKFVGEKTRAMVRALLSRLGDSEWCTVAAANPSSQRSRLSRINHIAALYKLDLGRKEPPSPSAPPLRKS